MTGVSCDVKSIVNYRHISAGCQLTLSWPAGHICPTYKESFQVRWDNSIPLFSMMPSTLKYLSFVEPVRMHFPAKQPCTKDIALQHCTQYHLYTAVSLENAFWLVQRNRDTSRLMAAWRKVGYCYPSGLEKTLCKWDIYVPLVTKGLKFLCSAVRMYTYYSRIT